MDMPLVMVLGILVSVTKVQSFTKLIYATFSQVQHVWIKEKLLSTSQAWCWATVSQYRYLILAYLRVDLEPGYYKEGAYGIRIENLLLTVDKFDGSFWGFLNLTMVPYETKLIKTDLLSTLDIEFINNYHKEVIHTALLLYWFWKCRCTRSWLRCSLSKITKKRWLGLSWKLRKYSDDFRLEIWTNKPR